MSFPILSTLQHSKEFLGSLSRDVFFKSLPKMFIFYYLLFLKSVVFIFRNSEWNPKGVEFSANGSFKEMVFTQCVLLVFEVLTHAPTWMHLENNELSEYVVTKDPILLNK